MSHPYTTDTRRPLLLRHAYWVAPYWIPGSVYYVRVQVIRDDACFSGYIGEDKAWLFGTGQTRFNCRVFSSRENAEKHALDRLRRTVTTWTDYSAECPDRRRTMILFQENGIDPNPRREVHTTVFSWNEPWKIRTEISGKEEHEDA